MIIDLEGQKFRIEKVNGEWSKPEPYEPAVGDMVAAVDFVQGQKALIPVVCAGGSNGMKRLFIADGEIRIDVPFSSRILFNGNVKATKSKE